MNQHIKFFKTYYKYLYLFYLFLTLYQKRSSYPEIYPEGSDDEEDGGYDLSRESQFINKWVDTQKLFGF
jgi:hypothetical protein